MRLEVHTKTDCPWCHEAKRYLKQHAIAYEVLLHDDDAERQGFYDSLKLEGAARTVPQVILVDDDGERHTIGGYQQLTMSGIVSLRDHGLAWDPDKPDAEGRVRPTPRYVEPYFMLRALDKFSVETAEFWLSKALPGLGENHPKIVSARLQIAAIQAWQQEHGAKHPD